MTIRLVISLFLLTFCGFFCFGQLPPPENRFYGREQNYLNPFKIDPEEALTCGQLIEYHGFQYEEHHVETKDGYILGLYRIVNHAARKARGNRLIPVLLVHGIAVSCGSWMFNTQVEAYSRPGGKSNANVEWVNGIPPIFPSNDLAIALASGEFQVWIGNSRGTSYSRNHTHLSPHESKFWDYDWVDMGLYDVPAMVDYVRNATDWEKIVYIGYSQGTMQMLTLLSDYPSFADKLSLNILISPIGYLNNPPGFASALPNMRPILQLLSAYVGPIFPFQPEFNAGLTLFCTVPLFRPICEEISNYIFGPDRRMLDHHHFPVLTSLIDTFSAKSIIHDLQSIHFGHLRRFDYGDDKNLLIYGSKYPPEFNFSNIVVRNLVFISGLNDYLASPENVQRLRNSLAGRVLVDHVITYPKWSHTDILFGKHAYEYAHSNIIKIIREYVDTGPNEQKLLD